MSSRWSKTRFRKNLLELIVDLSHNAFLNYYTRLPKINIYRRQISYVVAYRSPILNYYLQKYFTNNIDRKYSFAEISFSGIEKVDT